MTKTRQLRAFALYLTLGMPLAASCAKEANTLDTNGAGAASSTSGKGSLPTAGTLGKAGTTSANPFGGTATTGGTTSSAGDGSAEGGEAVTTGGKGGSGSTVPPEVLASAKAIVYYQTDHATPSDKIIRMVLHVVNQSDNALPMKNVKIRYWFTAEVPPTLHQYYTGEQVRPAYAMFVDDGDDSHVLMTFGGGELKKTSDLSVSEVQLQIDSSTTAFDQADDFSWQPTSTTSTPNGKITLYLDDKLIWGCEPSGTCAEDGTGTGGAGGAGAGGADSGGAGAGGAAAGGAGGQNAGGAP
jgi:hypothetical protein